jgi:hypothetical protein
MNASNENISERLTSADMIVGPWTMTLAGEAGGLVTPEIANAVINSKAKRLLIPVKAAGWEWAGVDDLQESALLQQTLTAIKQILENEPVKPARPMGAGAIIGIVIGVLFLLTFLTSILFSYFYGGF